MTRIIAQFTSIEEHKGKISDFAAEGAELLCKISNYTKAKLPKYGELCNETNMV